MSAGVTLMASSRGDVVVGDDFDGRAKRRRGLQFSITWKSLMKTHVVTISLPGLSRRT